MSAAVPPTEARGGCMCGRVRFVARFPSRFVGAAFVTWVGFLAPQVTITAGAEDLAVHESSPGTFRKFCRMCGTKLFFEGGKWPGETHAPLAAFDDPVDRAPQGHAFYQEHAAWLASLRDPPTQ